MLKSTRVGQNKRCKIMAAIPCYNTEKFVGDVASRSKKYVDQVVVVDDGSSDGTAQVATTAGALLINHPVNQGYGESIKSCLKAAKENTADVLIVLDGDGQHNPDELPQVLAPVIAGEADLVIGSRFLQWQSNIPRYRSFGINIINFLCNFGSKTKISDTQSGFRAYSKRALDNLILTERGMGLSAEVIIKAREKQLHIREVPISCCYHSDSSSLNPVLHGLGVALTVVKLRTKSLLNRLIRGNGNLKSQDV